MLGSSGSTAAAYEVMKGSSVVSCEPVNGEGVMKLSVEPPKGIAELGTTRKPVPWGPKYDRSRRRLSILRES